jgi:hypothetical protein
MTQSSIDSTFNNEISYGKCKIFIDGVRLNKTHPIRKGSIEIEVEKFAIKTSKRLEKAGKRSV